MEQKKSEKPKGYMMAMAHWPKERQSQGLGLSIKDGWNWGIGFGLAMAIAVPLILILLGCIIGLMVMTFGASLGAML